MTNVFDNPKSTITVNLSLEEYVNLHYFTALLKDSIVSKSDLNDTITFINANFTKVTGFTPQEVLGKTHSILRHPDNDPSLYRSLWATVKEGKIWRERLLNRNKDGSDFWAETTIIPLVSHETGAVIEYLCIRRDITDFLTLKRAVQAQEIKEKHQAELSKAKDDFLILFTHELKTPLNAIINFTSYLLKHEGKLDVLPQGKVKNLLVRIEEAAKKMLEHVTHILELSRLRSKKLIYTLSIFNSYESLHSVVEDQRGNAAARGVEITCETLCDIAKKGQSLYLHTDEYRFKQIFGNILSNAIKYSKTRVHLTFERTPTHWVLHVEDDGPGIKDKEAVFNLFEQDGNLINKGTEGSTGVGLTFVKYLCKDLGFTYELHTSKKLGGLEFCLMKEMKETL